MELNSAWNRYTDPVIRERIETKMRGIQQFENEVPCVITIHDARDISLMYMSPLGLQQLGVGIEEITLSFHEYHARFFNLEDAEDYVPKVTGLLKRNNTDEVISYFQQVRFAADKEWIWHLSSTRIFMRDLDGMPLLFITISMPIDSKSHVTAKVERLKEENDFIRKNNHLFSSLTKREREILKYLAQGLTPKEIGEKIHVSETTAITHKRNLKKKLKTQTAVDLMKFAQAFDLV
ncbi:MAG TPA: helix-turn-helix transcriptional regulator [Flavisolibacter sp.]|nr:helix-turn-helix transcriptional regulator [Flavisolibacter sp.]